MLSEEDREFVKKTLYFNPDRHPVHEVQPPAPAPTLADIITLLERQAKTCERIAITLTEIQYTVRQLK